MKTTKIKPPLKPRSPMTHADEVAVQALWRIRKQFDAGGFERGLIGNLHRNLDAERGITDLQRDWLWELVYRNLSKIDTRVRFWNWNLSKIAVQRHPTFDLREGMRRLRRKARKEAELANTPTLVS